VNYQNIKGSIAGIMNGMSVKLSQHSHPHELEIKMTSHYKFTIDGVTIGNWINCSFADRNSKYYRTIANSHTLPFGTGRAHSQSDVSSLVVVW
jgi:hypothetical protein